MRLLPAALPHFRLPPDPGRTLSRWVRWILHVLRIAGLVLGAPQLASAQDTQESAAVRVFLDCQTRCDGDHVRREIRFVSWVRDREDAQVHLLITSQRSGSGQRYDLAFIGRGAFEGDDAQLTFDSSDTDTTAERRDGRTRMIALGLVRYVSRTGDAERLSVSYQVPELSDAGLTAGSERVADPWDYWVFRARVDAGFSGESQQSSTNLFGSVNANRTTEALKIRLSAFAFYEEQRFDIDEQSLTSIARFSEANAYVAFSIRERMATGGRFDLFSSTFSNIDLGARAAWAFEVNIFPYAESTRRELTLLYTLGLSRLQYLERTIYEKLQETVPDHALIAALDLKQPWGDARASFTASQFLHDPSLYRLSARGGVEVRLFRGLSVEFSGTYEAVRDQIALRARDATPEEILLFRQELATDFRYRTSVGLTYRFGSIFNNVVNPRLDNFRRP